MIRRGIGVGSFVAAGGGTDADAQAFITAAAITDATQQSAINTLVVDLKAYGIWTKMKALYPFVGGTASTHKFNLKDPRDLDAAFRLVFSGGWTHSSTGALPNGTNAYADTFITPNSVFSSNNAHGSFYSRSNTAQSQRTSFGCYDTAGQPVFALLLNYSVTVKMYTGLGDGNYVVSGITNTDTTGFYSTSRTANNSLILKKNGLTVGSNTNTVIVNSFPSTKKLLISAINPTGNPIAEFDNKQVAFTSFGDGLTDTEAANLYTAVQAYQTTLSRNV
jgi:hypothetical protein